MVGVVRRVHGRGCTVVNVGLSAFVCAVAGGYYVTEANGGGMASVLDIGKRAW